jgi:hypothetical protein
VIEQDGYEDRISLPELVQHLQTLWKDKGIQRAFVEGTRVARFFYENQKMTLSEEFVK